MALIQINQFKGINQIADPTMLGEEGIEAYNVSIRDGVLKPSRKPIIYKNIANLTGINNIMLYSSNGVFKEIIATTPNGLYTTGTWASSWEKISTYGAEGYCDFVNDNVDGKNVIIIVRGNDNTIKYDGSNVLYLKMLGKTSDYPVLTNRAPKGYSILLHYDRLWIADSNSVYCSSITANGGIDIEDFTTPTSPPEEVNQHGAQISMYTTDASRIKGIVSVFDDILVFKERTIFKLSGTGPSDLQKIELFSGVGTIAIKSIATSLYGCFFMNTDGIYLYDGASVNKISQKIDKLWSTFEDRILTNASTMSSSIGVFYNNKYILAIKNSYDTNKCMIIEYDALTGDFITRSNYDIKSFLEFEDELLFASSDGYIYRYDKGTAENFIWQSGDLTMPEGAIEIEGVKLHTEGTGRLKVSVITEKKTKEKIVDIVKDGVKYISINNTGRGASVKLEQLSGDISIRKCYIEYDLDED